MRRGESLRGIMKWLKEVVQCKKKGQSVNRNQRAENEEVKNHEGIKREEWRTEQNKSGGRTVKATNNSKDGQSSMEQREAEATEEPRRREEKRARGKKERKRRADKSERERERLNERARRKVARDGCI